MLIQCDCRDNLIHFPPTWHVPRDHWTRREGPLPVENLSFSCHRCGSFAALVVRTDCEQGIDLSDVAPLNLFGARIGVASDMRSAIQRVEATMIRRALEGTSGRRAEAASSLGLNRTTLVEKIKKYKEIGLIPDED